MMNRKGLKALGMLAGAIALVSCAAAPPRPPEPVASASVGWPTYGNGYDAQRFSVLGRINPQNAASLKPICSLRLGDDGPFQPGPVVIGDTMYVTTTHTTVALDATDCAVRWRSVYTPDEIESWPVNRGAAYLDGRVFRGTPDGRLIALDAETGAQLWRVKIGEPSHGEAVPSAPIAWNGMVFVGLAVGDYGTRGRVLGFDAATGKQLWRFDTVPTGKEFGADTWASRPSALTGGGATWSSYTLDVERGELFIPVANPSPALAPGYRPGANLFTDSLLVLDARTGALKWWYQLIANDGHDWDLGAPAALYDAPDGRKIAVVGGKDGYAYGIDRDTHKLVFKTPVTTIKNATAKLTAAGTFACPGFVGGVEWNGPAYDPSRKAIYVGAVDWCAVFKINKVTLSDGRPDLGGVMTPKGPATGWVTALDGTTGKEIWRYHADAPIVAGVTPTAGGVVLTGDISGNFLALDSNDGKVLLKSPLGGALAGGVVTYEVGDRQFVAVTSGNISKFTFPAWSGSPTIVILGLDVPADGPRSVDVAESPVTNAGPDRGRALYAQFCTACHGASGEGATGPKLTGLAQRKSPADIVAQITNPKGAMPKLYPAPLGDRDVRAVVEYLARF